MLQIFECKRGNQFFKFGLGEIGWGISNFSKIKGGGTRLSPTVPLSRSKPFRYSLSLSCSSLNPALPFVSFCCHFPWHLFSPAFPISFFLNVPFHFFLHSLHSYLVCTNIIALLSWITISIPTLIYWKNYWPFEVNIFFIGLSFQT